MQTPQTGETPGVLTQNLYETDFYAWIQEQAKLLKHQQWSQLDLRMASIPVNLRQMM